VRELTTRMIDDEVNSPFWVLILENVQNGLNLIRNELEAGTVIERDEAGNGKEVVMDYSDLLTRQGECKAMRRFMQLPELLREKVVLRQRVVDRHNKKEGAK